MLAAVIALIVGLAAPNAAGAEDILGQRPAYTQRSLGIVPEAPIPNEAAIARRIWAPGLDDGYVPQGLTVIGGAIYLGSYRSPEVAVDRGPCRLFRIDSVNGTVTGTLDLPPACGHAGGIARGGPGRIWVVDTRAMFEIELSTEAGQGPGKVLREVHLTPPLKGSFAAGDGEALWIGSYERDKPGVLWRVPLDAVVGPTIGASQATRSISLPSRAQGAAFDAAGRLWIARSGATLGEILRMDAGSGAIEARYQVPAGVEDLSFDETGHLWTVSEAGSRRWSGWATFYPLVFQLDPARLR